jgi:hypothetical protein
MHRRPQVDADNSGEIDLAEFIVFVLTVQKLQVRRPKAYGACRTVLPLARWNGGWAPLT